VLVVGVKLGSCLALA
jgi:hypothetical protein